MTPLVCVCVVDGVYCAQGERRIRGSGVYPMSSLLNHDCMPNVARYDYFDGPQEDNTIVEFRALHDIPADTQITQSYFPLSWWACFAHVPIAAAAAAAVVAAATNVDAFDRD